MTLFSWKCVVCRLKTDSFDRPLCPSCGHAMVRDYSTVQMKSSAFQPHFNHAVGRYVSSSRDFDHALALGAEQQNSTYTRIDPGDREFNPQGDTQNLEDSAKVKRDRGLTPPPSSTVIPL